MAKIVRSAGALAIVAASLGCRGATGRLAVVGGRTVTSEKLSAFVISQTGRPLSEVSPDLAAALFERYLDEEVVLAASPTPGDRDLTPTARSARVRDLSAALCPPPPSPSEAQLDAYLVAHPEMASGGDRVKLRQLILPDQVTARSARDRARSGDDWATLSRELSRAPNAGGGGVLGWVERGQLPPEFEAAVFGLSKGDVSEPVPSNAGWHLFQVMERRRPGEGPDPELRERARIQLTAEQADANQRTCLQTLAAKVGVRVECADASFPCRDPFEVKR
ncbi:MAG TPA: peptidylprolyl isomerase [Thermoanaerobaculaceae bacterium]|nr:peptidylprolyl isomerase [Thermoanaerobaculaceae bacterium]